MAVYSIIQQSKLEEHINLCADFYHPDKLETKANLKIQSTYTIADFFNINGQTIHSSDIKKASRYTTIRVLDLTDALGGFLRSGNSVGSIEEIGSNKKILKKNNVLISRLRSYLKEIGIAKNIPANTLLLGSTEFFVLEQKKDMLPETLFIFLNTKQVQTILAHCQTGVNHPRFPKYSLGAVPVPNSILKIQLQIKKMVNDAHQKQTRSKELYKEAEEILLQELDLKDFKPEERLTFETTKKGIEEANRFDAEYFQPKYEQITKKIESYEGGFDVVGNIVNFKKGTEVGSHAYFDEGKEFVRVSDFSITGIEDTAKKISTEIYKKLKNKFQPKIGEILFSKDGTIGVSYVLKEKIEGILCGAFLRLTLKEKYHNFEKECLSLIFNSKICKIQVKKFSGGALIAHLRPTIFKTFKIPLIKSQIQTDIAEKVQESHKLRKESKQLLEEAKTKVEERIEQEAN